MRKSEWQAKLRNANPALVPARADEPKAGPSMPVVVFERPEDLEGWFDGVIPLNNPTLEPSFRRSLDEFGYAKDAELIVQQDRESLSGALRVMIAIDSVDSSTSPAVRTRTVLRPRPEMRKGGLYFHVSVPRHRPSRLSALLWSAPSTSTLMQAFLADMIHFGGWPLSTLFANVVVDRNGDVHGELHDGCSGEKSQFSIRLRDGDSNVDAPPYPGAIATISDLVLREMGF